MKVIYGLEGLRSPIKRAAVTIGVFDGVHRGHRAVIRRVVSAARSAKLKSVVLTFHPHPFSVLRPHQYIPSLISLKHRLEIIRGFGVDYVIILRFTPSVARLRPENFIRKILIGRLGLVKLYVGENFFFGKGARAGIDLLKRAGRSGSFTVTAVKPVELSGSVISSTLIRRLIMKGQLDKAARCLGRPVSILGTVVGGARRGRRLGFPTANIDPHHEAIPPSGVYAVRVNVKGRAYAGILNIGFRPTFERADRPSEPVIEVHIFNFKRDIYGEDLEIIFVKNIRRELRFSSEEQLVAQIGRDMMAACRILGYKKLYKIR